MKLWRILLPAVLAVACHRPSPRVLVYGGTSAGVIAAYSAAQSGADVFFVVPEGRFGGMTSGGLGYTDIGNKQVVKGLSKKFYRMTGAHYGQLESWIFEPHVAEAIFQGFAAHPRIRVMPGLWLESADTLDGRIRSVTLSDGSAHSTVQADQFIDASYEGDLMAAAGVSWTLGREDNSRYGETWNGAQLLQGHQFPDGIDPYRIEGKPSSGFLPGLSVMDVTPGKGDSLVQAYNFRICLTDSLENQVPITAPAGYDPDRYELLRRLMRARPDRLSPRDYLMWSRMPRRKTDINNFGGFSTDVIGLSQAWPTASPAARKGLFRQHKEYTEGLLYFLGHDPAVPEPIRREMLRWGYAKDEFGGGLSPQLYVREGRRLVGEWVCTQADCEGRTAPEDAVAMAAYTMDSHNCRRGVIYKDGRAMVKNEGNVEIPGGGPYPIPYRALTPKRSECTNLLVPVCLSASHIAFGSIRMEPVFMVLGQVCGMAAVMAGPGAVQDVSVPDLLERFERDPYLDGSTPDVLMDDDSPRVEVPAGWMRERGSTGYGPTFLRSEPGDTTGTVLYRLPALRGTWAVYAYQQNIWANPYPVYTLEAGKARTVTPVDMQSVAIGGQTSGEWIPVGTADLRRGGTLSVRYRATGDLPCKADAIVLVKQVP